MSTTKHTPGPWHLAFPGNVINHSDGNIASVNPAPDNKEGNADRGKANGLLMTAAPEMLDALDQAEDALRWYYDNPRDTAVAHNALLEIREAITRATGRTFEPLSPSC